MVYPSSYCHIITLEDTRNMQSTTPNRHFKNKISGAVLVCNAMAGNLPQIKNIRLPCAILIEPVVANSTGYQRWKQYFMCKNHNFVIISIKKLQYKMVKNLPKGNIRLNNIQHI